MIYTYTTYPQTHHTIELFIINMLVSLFFTIMFYGIYVTQKETDEVISGTKTPGIPFWKFAVTICAIVFVPFIYHVITSKNYVNEQVIATMVETGESTYKSGKYSYVKGATVTYKLPDGGLVTYRADGGAAWYPEIILYKNPQ